MFYSRLREARRNKHLTQQQMADLLAISLNGYQKYEQNERQPPLDTLVQIADILDASIDYLLCRDCFLAKHADEHQTDLLENPTP